VSWLGWAWTIVAFLVGVLVIALCWVMANLFRVLTATRDLIDGVTRQTVPLLGEVNTSVKLVNQELGRVDGILGSVESIVASVRHLVEVVGNTITSPLVRASAFFYGLRRAVGKAGEEPEPRGRFRRRRR
jgi:uncharacterized protein YoxC